MDTFIPKDRLTCKNVKGIIKNVVDDNLKYESLKVFRWINHIIKMKWTEYRAKIKLKKPITVIKCLCLVKNYILQDEFSDAMHLQKSYR